MTREEWLAIAKLRALRYLPGDPLNAIASLASDFQKEPGLGLQRHPRLASMPVGRGAHDNPVVVKDWIEGFK